MKPEEIVIGKTYRIRSWEDITQNGIEAERWLAIRRWRDTSPSSVSVLFTEDMRPLCGMDFTVKSKGGFLDQLRPEEHYDLLNEYIITPWMLEEIQDTEEQIQYEFSDSDLSDFLFSGKEALR